MVTKRARSCSYNLSLHGFSNLGATRSLDNRLVGHRLRLLGHTLLVVLLALLTGCQGKDSVSAPHLKATLIADQDSISPGSTFTLGIQFTLEPGWHIYWKNPGDSGLPPRFSWSAPPGISVSEPLWPYPSKIATGPLVNYGYGDVLIPFQARVAQTAKTETAVITAALEWLVCKDECLPGQGSISLALPLRNETSLPSTHSKAFERAFATIPAPLERVSIAIEEQADQLILALIPLKGGFLPPAAVFFPEDRRILSNSAEQAITRDGDVLRLTLTRDQSHQEPINRVRGVLVSPHGWSTSGTPLAVSIDTNPNAPAPSDALTKQASHPVGADTSQAPIGFFAAILSALLGGLLLNIMPCVFPVLSIKILGFVEHAGHDPRSTRNHGLAFSFGVIASFWIVAFLLFTLRAGGEQLGWGFQLQSPTFVVAMMITFLGIGLLFLSELNIGQQLQNLAGRTHIPTSLLGSFLNGALATAVATPCTAPYMGTALAATLAMPAALSFLIFTALGVGMSAPYLLLSYRPQLLKYLPRPGEWMVTFKQLMAFPLFASVVWLTRVFMRQMGLEPPALTVVTSALWGLLGIAFAFWLYMRASTTKSSRSRLAITTIAALTCASSVYSALPSQEAIDESRARACSPTSGPLPFTDSHGLLWESFSEDRLAKVLAQGRPVYIDFTAEWCITCQVNERVVFSSEEVRNLLIKKNVTLMQADWTSKNPVITNALRRFGRSGVPLNVIIASPSAAPVLLPNILTPGIVREALEKLP
jgi:thiol:disulfide interchange protein/DsbC/DsbD-like thiol-disulfide interchange protein